MRAKVRGRGPLLVVGLTAALIASGCARMGYGPAGQPSDTSPERDLGGGDVGDLTPRDALEQGPLRLDLSDFWVPDIGELGPPGPVTLVPDVVSGLALTGKPGAPIRFTVINATNTPSGTLMQPFLTGTEASFFSLRNNGCRLKSLAPAEHCTFELLPRALADGPFSASCHVHDGAFRSNLAALSGAATGVAPPPSGICTPQRWCWYYPAPHASSLEALLDTGDGAVLAVGNAGVSALSESSGWGAHQTPTTRSLHGLWTVGASTLFAAGAEGTILRHDGKSWENMLSPTTTTLRGGWGAHPNDVYAYGGGGVLHFDGNSWSAVDAGTTAALNHHAFVSPTHVTLAGTGGSVVHFDGTSWSSTTTGSGVSLTGIWASLGGDRIYLIGGAETWEQIDGGPLTRVNLVNTQPLHGVWGSADGTIFTAGKEGTIHRLLPGGAWLPLSTGVTESLNTLSGRSATDVYAGGDNGTLLHFDGAGWAPTGVSLEGSVNQVKPCALGMCAVGSYGFSAHGSARSWSWQGGERISTSLKWVTPRYTGHIVAVGPDPIAGREVVFSRDEKGTNVTPLGLTEALSSVFILSKDNIYLIDRADGVWHFDGAGLTPITIPDLTRRPTRIWGTRPDDLYLIASSFSGSDIHHYHGGVWKKIEPVIPFGALTAVFAFSPTDVFVVGHAGEVRHYDGAFWYPMNGRTTERFASVWGSVTTNVYAVTDKGTVVHYDGDSWAIVKTGLTSRPSRIWGTSASDIYLFGAGFAHFDGERWTEVTLPVAERVVGLTTGGGRTFATTAHAIFERR